MEQFGDNGNKDITGIVLRLGVKRGAVELFADMAGTRSGEQF